MLSLSAGGSGREFVRTHMGVSKNMGIKEYGSPHKHHHPNGSRWGNQWCRCQMDTHAHCAHRSFPSGVPIGLTKGLIHSSQDHCGVSGAFMIFFYVFLRRRAVFWGPARQKNRWGLSYISGCIKVLRTNCSRTTSWFEEHVHRKAMLEIDKREMIVLRKQSDELILRMNVVSVVGWSWPDVCRVMWMNN